MESARVATKRRRQSVSRGVEDMKWHVAPLIKSANPDYTDYTCLAEDVHIAGKVLWTMRRA